MHIKQQPPQIKNTFGPRFALPGPSSTMYGVENPIAKLKSQFVAVVMERALARSLSGKSSPVTTQATGPQEQAKKKMYMQTNEMRILLATREAVVIPTIATTNWAIHIPIAPMRRRLRRPIFSTR